MAAKLKVDQLETVDGTGNITVNNQLTGLTSASMPTGSVLQVVSVNKDDTFSTTSSSWVDVTGSSISITPSATTSKIKVDASYSVGNTNVSYKINTRLMRDTTPINVGGVAGSRNQSTVTTAVYSAGAQVPVGTTYLDSPSTTSSITYKLQIKTENVGTAVLGRSGSDPDNAITGRTPLNITLMEIAG